MKKYNFSAGPSILPKPVIEKIMSELPSYNGTGYSIMELSHRGKNYIKVHNQTKQLVRDLLLIPEDFEILFLQGGATGQFSAVPLNILSQFCKAGYVDSGQWAKKAIKEYLIYSDNIEIKESPDNYKSFPLSKNWGFSKNLDYIHVTHNETINGIEMFEDPKLGIPLIADMSSNIFSRRIDFNSFDLIYAGAQKNFGPSGLTLAIINKKLITERPKVLSVLNYKKICDNDSMLNTPPTFSVYVASLVLEWIKSLGGVSTMEKNAKERSTLLYDYIDSSSFYINSIELSSRSRMNVPFNISDESLNDSFLSEAHHNGLFELKGHRSVGGFRASIYNAMPIEGVRVLIDFMKDFERKYG